MPQGWRMCFHHWSKYIFFFVVIVTVKYFHQYCVLSLTYLCIVSQHIYIFFNRLIWDTTFPINLEIDTASILLASLDLPRSKQYHNNLLPIDLI